MGGIIWFFSFEWIFWPLRVIQEIHPLFVGGTLRKTTVFLENLVKSSAHFSRHEAEVLLNVSPGFCCPPYSAGLGIKGKFGQNCKGTSWCGLRRLWKNFFGETSFAPPFPENVVTYIFLSCNTPPMVYFLKLVLGRGAYLRWAPPPRGGLGFLDSWETFRKVFNIAI